MIVSCQDCGTRFRHANVEPSHATGECSVCHADVPLVASRKPYLLIQAGGLKPVAIGMDDPTLAAGLATAGASVEMDRLQPFEADAPFAGDHAGPIEAAPASELPLEGEQPQAARTGMADNLIRFAFPVVSFGAATYYVAGPLGLTAPIGGSTWMWVAGAAAFGAIVGFALVRWKSKKA